MRAMLARLQLLQRPEWPHSSDEPGETLTMVKRCAKRAGIENLAPHDLRRGCARLCHRCGGELEQIQFLLGHASVQTPERDIAHLPDLEVTQVLRRLALQGVVSYIVLTMRSAICWISVLLGILISCSCPASGNSVTTFLPMMRPTLWFPKSSEAR
jgi:hypothetical protein